MMEGHRVTVTYTAEAEVEVEAVSMEEAKAKALALWDTQGVHECHTDEYDFKVVYVKCLANGKYDDCVYHHPSRLMKNEDE
jgi:hypothetical protein